MADFIVSYTVTNKREGGYVNDSVDLGKETYRGISRKSWPKWSGWIIIDRYKNSYNFPDILYSDQLLDIKVKQFYKNNFWDINSLDNFSSQKIADEMFDTGVNMGTRTVAKHLQVALNILNNGGERYSDISEDGAVGPNTIKALNSCLEHEDGEENIYKIINILQGFHYIFRMRESPSQEKFARGWLKRVEFLKTFD